MSAITVNAEDVATSGTCGENLTWEFDEATGTLTISGIGEMDDYDYDNRPWEECEDIIKNVVINNGVITVGDKAFYHCDSLTNITIPESVTEIGSKAFNDCISLTSITIPETVAEIGHDAFYNTAYYNESSNWENGVLYIDNHLIDANSNLPVNYTIKEGTLTIADRAFLHCGSLTSITIPESVTTIGFNVFGECKSMTSIIIPDSITSIGDLAFDHCSNLTSVIIGNGVKFIDYEAFNYCTNLTSVTIPDSVKIIDSGAFQGCTGLTSITIPESVTELGSYLFRGCTSLTSITIPDSVETIGNDAFDGCTSLMNIKLPDNITIGQDAFDNTACYNESSNWENGILYIDNHLIDAESSLSGICIIKEGTLTIAECAFLECTNLTDITIPNGVTKIGMGAFYYCTSLKSITIPDSLTTIGLMAFYYCTSLESFIVDDDNQHYSCDEHFVLFNKDKTELIQYPVCNTNTNYSIPNTVETIGDGAFVQCSNLTTVTIPDGVKRIGNSAFAYCINLTSITIPDSVTMIYDMAFLYCSALTSVTIGKGVTRIPYGAFYWCTSLASIVIPDSVTVIADEGFYTGSLIKDVYYTGTEEQFWKIQFGNGNSYLGYATLHYNLEGYNGIYSDYLYIDGVKQKAYQLVEFEGDYYFINDGHKIAKNKRIYLTERFVNGFTYADGTPLAVGYYDFDENGKMIINNGVVGDYFYKNNVRQNAYQLVEFEGDFYFINDSHKIAKNMCLYLGEKFVNGFTYADGTPLQAGYYTFDENGKMVMHNGPVGDYFYKNGVRQKAYQLVEFEGDYYFINDSHKLAKNKRIYLSQKFVEGTELKVGYYDFDAEGKLIMLNGPVGDYFYKNNVRLKAYQLVEFEGNYYFINDSNKLAKNKRLYMSQRFVEGTDLEVGWYNFDADGKMIIE